MTDSAGTNQHDAHLARVRAQVERAVVGAAERLAVAGARDEILGEYHAPRTVLKVFRKDAVILPVGKVWRVGVFLIDADGGLYETGSTTRAHAPERRGATSVSVEIRRETAAAAFRGRVPEGETVNYDWQRIHPAELGAEPSADGGPVSSGPLLLIDGVARVRWGSGAGTIPFANYLSDRVGLLIDPPAGA